MLKIRKKKRNRKKNPQKQNGYGLMKGKRTRMKQKSSWMKGSLQLQIKKLNARKRNRH